MTKQPTLQELFAHAKKGAFLMFHERGEILPMWHAVAGDNEHIIIATPWGDDDDKDQTVEALRAMFRERKVKMFVFISEAWYLRLEEPVSKSRLLLEEMPVPSKHPDRREVLRVNAEDSFGNTLSGQYYILRPEHGKPTLSPFEQDEAGGMTAGRLSGMLVTSKNYN